MQYNRPILLSFTSFSARRALRSRLACMYCLYNLSNSSLEDYTIVPLRFFVLLDLSNLLYLWFISSRAYSKDTTRLTLFIKSFINYCFSFSDSSLSYYIPYSIKSLLNSSNLSSCFISASSLFLRCFTSLVKLQHLASYTFIYPSALSYLSYDSVNYYYKVAISADCYYKFRWKLYRGVL